MHEYKVQEACGEEARREEADGEKARSKARREEAGGEETCSETGGERYEEPPKSAEASAKHSREKFHIFHIHGRDFLLKVEFFIDYT